MSKLLIPAIIAGFLLSACTTGQQALLEATIKSGQDTKDAEAKTLKAGVCATSIGSNIRVNSPEERAALDVLCGGSKSQTVTTDDVLLLRRLMGLVSTSEQTPIPGILLETPK